MKAPRCNHSDTPFFQVVQNRRKSASAASAASALSKINSLGPVFRGPSRPPNTNPRPPSTDRVRRSCAARQQSPRATQYKSLEEGNDDRADEDEGVADASRDDRLQRQGQGYVVPDSFTQALPRSAYLAHERNEGR